MISSTHATIRPDPQTRADSPKQSLHADGPPSGNLPLTTALFGSYLAVGFAWYVKPIGGAPALPLALPKGSKKPLAEPTPARLRSFERHTNVEWLAARPFRLVLGAGFVGGLYRHLGLLLALSERGLAPRDVVGVSAGAIVGAMYCTLPLQGEHSVESCLMTLHPLDFLDPSLTSLVKNGAVCPGNALVKKLERTFAPSGKTDFSQTSPPLSAIIFDTHTGETSLLNRGPLVQAVRWSASLPMMFEAGRYIDGGWVDQNGLSAMVPGERCINHRIYDGDGSRGWMEWRINRPQAVYAPSLDSEHRTLHFRGPEKITEANFIFALRDAPKLQRITNYYRQSTHEWMMQPACTPDSVLQGEPL